jgi:hypothetical protein
MFTSGAAKSAPRTIGSRSRLIATTESRGPLVILSVGLGLDGKPTVGIEDTNIAIVQVQFTHLRTWESPRVDDTGATPPDQEASSRLQAPRPIPP